MPEKQAKYGIFMTVAACLWLGLFPLLQGFTYAQITLDKWRIMLVLCGVTFAYKSLMWSIVKRPGYLRKYMTGDCWPITHQ